MKRSDYSSKDIASRVKEGREVWEPFVKKALEKHGITITASTEREDMLNKIDGWFNGESVQIKIRNTSIKGRNDLSFELIQNYDPMVSLTRQMNNRSTAGRDWKCNAKHYFILNQESSTIFHLDGAKVKREIRHAVEELEAEDFDLRTGIFTYENSIQINATKDRDHNSHTPSKVMVFIPVKLVLLKEYEISESK